MSVPYSLVYTPQNDNTLYFLHDLTLDQLKDMTWQNDGTWYATINGVPMVIQKVVNRLTNVETSGSGLTSLLDDLVTPTSSTSNINWLGIAALLILLTVGGFLIYKGVKKNVE